MHIDSEELYSTHQSKIIYQQKYNSAFVFREQFVIDMISNLHTQY